MTPEEAIKEIRNILKNIMMEKPDGSNHCMLSAEGVLRLVTDEKSPKREEGLQDGR